MVIGLDQAPAQALASGFVTNPSSIEATDSVLRGQRVQCLRGGVAEDPARDGTEIAIRTHHFDVHPDITIPSDRDQGEIARVGEAEVQPPALARSTQPWSFPSRPLKGQLRRVGGEIARQHRPEEDARGDPTRPIVVKPKAGRSGLLVGRQHPCFVGAPVHTGSPHVDLIDRELGLTRW